MSAQVFQYAACVWVHGVSGATAPLHARSVQAYTAADAIAQYQLDPDVAVDVEHGGQLEVTPDPDGHVARKWEQRYNQAIRFTQERSG